MCDIVSEATWDIEWDTAKKWETIININLKMAISDNVNKLQILKRHNFPI